MGSYDVFENMRQLRSFHQALSLTISLADADFVSFVNSHLGSKQVAGISYGEALACFLVRTALAQLAEFHESFMQILGTTRFGEKTSCEELQRLEKTAHFF